MRKLFLIALLLALGVGVADAGIISRPTKTTGGTSYQDGTIPHASDFNGDIDLLYSTVNGSLDNSNIAVGAAVAGSKITPNFTANVQVTTAAAPCFVNIDSSQGSDLKQWRICQSAGVLSIATYTDAGAVIITPLSVARATGIITLSGGLVISSGTLTISSAVANAFIATGAGGVITSGTGTNGQLLIGSTGAAPVIGNIIGTANKVSVTNGAGSITLSLPVGVILDTATTTADPGAALGVATKQYVDAQIAAATAALIPSGTLMLLQQTNCPSGWTKGATHDNKALRVVTGTASSGGSVGFTTAFAAGSIPSITGAHQLTSAEMPSHTHPQAATTELAGGTGGFSFTTGATTTSQGGTTGSTGGDGTHTHTIASQSLAVNYVDVIICGKN